MSEGEDLNPGSTGTANNGSISLSNGEAGREPPKVYNNSADNLNFGWFSLPRDEQNAGGSRHGSRPASVCGRKPQSGRPPSQGGAAYGQQGGPPDYNGGNQPGSESNLPPPSRQGYPQQKPIDSQRLVVNHDADMADFERSDHNCQQEYQMHPAADQCRGQGDDSTGQEYQREVEVVDWPLSRAAQEMLMRKAHPPAEPGLTFMDKKGTSSRPGSRGGTPSVPAVPPTPMPPLHWDGYKDTNRPTFASWRERWHRDHSLTQPHCLSQCPRGRNRRETEQRHNIFGDFNNNYNVESEITGTHCDSKLSDAVTVKGSTKNSNNNNGYDSSCVIKDDKGNLREDQGYWNKHWRDDHVTNIGTEFIGYDGSIFRAVKGSGQCKKAAPKEKNGNKSITLCVKREINSAFRKRIKKRASVVDPIVQTNGSGLDTCRSEMAARYEDIDTVEEGPPKHSKPIKKKTSFVLNVLTRVKNFKKAASCWGKKVSGRTLPRNTYCQFENDF
ncbi:hypothetical protein EGW08_018555 [Elysia chlorotica]|uniref:Uncharacterized protein n=1 Tax=Elysia chlorotica TaxID=188477 RepID=A0A433SWJ4_ELYCH|nr:hypothetical protein EGW08_018555 [Elysia chlorotica]